MRKPVALLLAIAVSTVVGCTSRKVEYAPAVSYEPHAMMRGEPAAPDLTQTMNDAANAYQSFLDKRANAVPVSRLQNDAACVAVVPTFTSTALVVGTSGGRGVVTCKAAGAGSPWSAPSFFSIRNTSLGAQLGRETSSLITYAIGNDAVSRFTRGDTFTLGTDIGATAGGVSGDLALSTRGGVQSYVVDRSGAFVGASLSGSSITPDTGADERYYGTGMTPGQILTRAAVEEPMTPAALRFISLLPV